MRLDNKLLDNSINFLKRRMAELGGLFLVFISVLFIFSLAIYSPENPSFILNSEELDFTNYIGSSLSNAISDIFLQSFGLVSFFIGISFLLWGLI